MPTNGAAESPKVPTALDRFEAWVRRTAGRLATVGEENATALVFVASFLVLAGFLWDYRDIPVYHDAMLQWDAATQFRSELWFPFRRKYDAGHPPLVAWVWAALQALSLPPRLSFHLMSWAAAAAFAAAVFAVCSRVANRPVGLAVAAITLCHPTVLGQSLQLNLDLYLAAFTWLMLLAVADGRPGLLALLGTLAVLTKLNGMFVLGPFMILAAWRLLFEPAHRNLRSWWQAWWPLLLPLVVFAAYHAVKYQAVGHVFDTGEFESGKQRALVSSLAQYGERVQNSFNQFLNYNGNRFVLAVAWVGGGLLVLTQWLRRVREELAGLGSPANAVEAPTSNAFWTPALRWHLVALMVLLVATQVGLQSLRLIAVIERYFILCYPVLIGAAVATFGVVAGPRLRTPVLLLLSLVLGANYLIRANNYWPVKVATRLDRSLQYPEMNLGTNYEVNLTFADQTKLLRRVREHLDSTMPEGAYLDIPWPFNLMLTHPDHGIADKATHYFWPRREGQRHDYVIRMSRDYRDAEPESLEAPEGYHLERVVRLRLLWSALYRRQGE